MSMKVFTLTVSDWDSHEFFGVFSTQEKAEAAGKEIASRHSTYRKIDMYDIDSYNLDEIPEFFSRADMIAQMEKRRQAPVEYIPDFLSLSAFDIDDLWRDVDWEQREAPRRECWMNDFGIDYTYGTGRGERTYKAKDWHPIASYIKNGLRRAGHELQGCFINGYEDEKQHLGWHSDDSPEMDDDKVIAVVSFGAERKIFFRQIGRKGPASDEQCLEHGSLLIMKPGMQQNWEHRIPKHSRPCGPRISFTFRGIVR